MVHIDSTQKFNKIAVTIPSHNDGSSVASTIKAFVNNASEPTNIQFGIVDDGSDISPVDSCALEQLESETGCEIRVHRQSRKGVAVSRNAAVRLTDHPIILITDAHVTPSKNWDTEILKVISIDRVLALTIGDSKSGFRGYGCDLVVPFMGTRWIRSKPKSLSKVAVASSAGTVIFRTLFDRVGGFDENMRVYGAIEPEFSVRVWLSGAEIRVMTNVVIHHKFKSSSCVKDFLHNHRVDMLHNSLRFGMIYLDDSRILQMLRYYAVKFPDEFPLSLKFIEKSDTWERREKINARSSRSFTWMCQVLRIRDHIGEPVWLNPILKLHHK